MKRKIKKIYIILIIAIICVISLLLLFNFLKVTNTLNDEYSQKMHDYSLYNLYASENDKYVSKIELLKIVVCATINSNTLPIQTSEPSDSDWLEYGKEKGYIIKDSINEKNYNQKAKLIEAIEMISNAKYYVLLKDYDVSKNVSFSDISKYSKEQQEHIKDLVSNEILEDRNASLKGNKKLTKQQLNEMVVKYINKFNLLTAGKDNIQLDDNKKPSNKSDYAYIDKNVEKEVYEQPYVQNQSNEACNSLEYYKIKKDYFDITAKICEDYYNTILNIDYRTVNYDDLNNELQKLVVGSVKEEELKKYIDYVKANKIVLKGKATVQMPCIYYDGLENIVRTKLEFEIIESDTNENILYMDLSESTNKVYSDNNLIYIDARLGYVLNSDKSYVYQNPINKMLLEMSKGKIEVK